MTTLNFPIVISSGGSQLSRDWYAKFLSLPVDSVKLFPEVVAEQLHGYSHNVAAPGRSNRMILRKALYECIKQLENNPGQRTIVLVELTFDLRKDVWFESLENNDYSESNFVSIQLAMTEDWWSKRIQRKPQDGVNICDQLKKDKLNSMDKKYLTMWQKAEQYFYSPYAENINLIMDLINFTGFMKANNIEYLIFRGPPVEPFQEEHLLNTFDKFISTDSNVLDLKNFGFNQWCIDNNYPPLDWLDRPEIGHPSIEAHKAFGLFLTEKLIKLQK